MTRMVARLKPGQLPGLYGGQPESETVEIEWVPVVEPQTFERIDGPFCPDMVKYRLDCPACNKRIEMRASREVVRKWKLEPRPTDPFGVFLAYHFEGRAEKEADNLRAHDVERNIFERMAHMAMRGDDSCEHFRDADALRALGERTLPLKTGEQER